jgi:glutamate--cysteine ligase
MYDQTVLDAAWDLVKGFDAETREELRVAASVEGLAGRSGVVRISDLARAAVALSQAGLAGRGLGEERYLAPLVEAVETGMTQADRWLALYRGDWGGDLTPIYQAASL